MSKAFRLMMISSDTLDFGRSARDAVVRFAPRMHWLDKEEVCIVFNLISYMIDQVDFASTVYSSSKHHNASCSGRAQTLLQSSSTSLSSKCYQVILN
ncbi:hypothetical protein ACLB2K_024647 [Fragaria x ananassa]